MWSNVGERGSKGSKLKHPTMLSRLKGHTPKRSTPLSSQQDCVPSPPLHQPTNQSTARLPAISTPHHWLLLRWYKFPEAKSCWLLAGYSACPSTKPDQWESRPFRKGWGTFQQEAVAGGGVLGHATHSVNLRTWKERGNSPGPPTHYSLWTHDYSHGYMLAVGLHTHTMTHCLIYLIRYISSLHQKLPILFLPSNHSHWGGETSMSPFEKANSSLATC